MRPCKVGRPKELCKAHRALATTSYSPPSLYARVAKSDWRGLLQRSIVWIPLERRTFDLLHLLHPDLE
ncbi:hypothetical protein BHM03_00045530 [Ensete ventricosum]|nr:hypothetical protein BHM03_00045530 [Ensete ventricosum]